MVDIRRRQVQMLIAKTLRELRGMVSAYNAVYYDGKDETKSLKKIDKLREIWM